MKYITYLKLFSISICLAVIPNVGFASDNVSKNLSLIAGHADFSSISWQEDNGKDKRQQPGKDKKDQNKRTTVKEVPKSKPKLRPEHVDEGRGNKPPSGKGKK